MTPEVHFSNIREVIKKKLEEASSSVRIAVAWFTDKELFDILILKSKKGIQVELILNDDHINSGSEINFEYLFANGGKVYHPKDYNNLMHNKFCVIDNNLVLNGSFNWTNKANHNNENLIILQGTETAQKFINEFNVLKQNCNSIEMIYDPEYLQDLQCEERLSAHELYKRGCSRMKIKNFHAAILDFNKALSIEDYDLYFELGQCYYGIDNYELAIQHYTKYLALNINSTSAYFNRGLAYHCSSRFFKAYLDFKTLISIKPQEAEYYVQKAKNLVRYIHLLEFERYLGFNRNHELSTKEAEKLIIANYNSRDHLQYALSKPNHDHDVTIGLISSNVTPWTTKVEKKLVSEAIEDFKKANTLGYSNKSYLFDNLASLHDKLSDYDNSIYYHCLRIQLDPNNSEAFFERGQNYYRKEEYTNALEDLKQALSLAKNENDKARYSKVLSKYRESAFSQQKKSKGIFGWLS
jgi:tetratricopeptide (TPR) repeat protein